VTQQLSVEGRELKMDFLKTFDLDLDKEIYYAGEAVTGRVVVENTENMRFNGKSYTFSLSFTDCPKYSVLLCKHFFLLFVLRFLTVLLRILNLTVSMPLSFCVSLF
jgi:hypothetical protein